MVAEPRVDQSVRPEWLFELANLIQRLTCPSACVSFSDLLETFKPDSELERRMQQALLQRIQPRQDGGATDPIGRCETLGRNDPRPESRTVAIAVDEVQRLLRTEHMKSWTVEAVARRVGCNRTDLEAAFRRRGLPSVHAYLVSCRIDAAKNLLRTTAWRVQEIAKEVGYRSKTSLFEQFRRAVGISPEQYRERWKPTRPTPDVIRLLQSRDRTKG